MEGPAVIQIGQDVVIPVVFDFLLFHHLLSDPDVPIAGLQGFQPHPAGIPALFQAENTQAPVLGDFFTAVLQALCPPLKFVRGENGLGRRILHQHLEQLPGPVHFPRFLIVFKRADGDPRHLYDAGQAEGRVGHLLAEGLDRVGQFVNFGDAHRFQVDGLAGIAVPQLAHQRRDGPGDELGHNLDADDAEHQGREQRHGDEPLHRTGKPQQLLLVGHADEHPLIRLEWGMAVIQLERVNGRGRLLLSAGLRVVNVFKFLAFLKGEDQRIPQQIAQHGAALGDRGAAGSSDASRTASR